MLFGGSDIFSRKYKKENLKCFVEYCTIYYLLFIYLNEDIQSICILPCEEDPKI